MENYVIYLRKSRADTEAELRGEGETLARHEKTLLALAKQQRLHINEIYREIVSGETIASRPVMQQLLSEIEQGVWSGVIVMELERLARGETIDQGIVAQAFKYSDTKIITPQKTYDPSNEFDEEYFEFGLFMSRREYKTINRRLQGGRVASVKEGKYVGNKPPYGYIRKPLEKDKGFTLVPNPEQAPVIKMIFDLFTGGSGEQIGVSLIVRRLNDLKIPSMTGDIWVPSTIQTILRNPVYFGKIRWNSRPSVKKVVDGKIKKIRPRAKVEDWLLVDGLHEAIISKETFDLANKLLQTNHSHPCPSSFTIKNPLAGLIVCGKCGRNMVRRPYTKKELPATLICALTSCDNISAKLHLVEHEIIEALKLLLRDYKLKKQSNSKASYNIDMLKKALLKLQNELIILGKQKESAYDLLEQNVYTTEIFLERTKSLADKVVITNRDIEKINAEIEKAEIAYQERKQLIPKIESIIKTYQTLKDPAAKNNLLKQVLDRVIYLKEQKCVRGGSTDSFTLILQPKTYY